MSGGIGNNGELYEKAKKEIDRTVSNGKIDQLKLLTVFESIIAEICRKK